MNFWDLRKSKTYLQNNFEIITVAFECHVSLGLETWNVGGPTVKSMAQIIYSSQMSHHKIDQPVEIGQIKQFRFWGLVFDPLRLTFQKYRVEKGRKLKINLSKMANNMVKNPALNPKDVGTGFRIEYNLLMWRISYSYQWNAT